MANVVSFIETQINNLSNDFLSSEKKDLCLEINDILNNPRIDNYEQWLSQKDDDIERIVSLMFFSMREKLYLSLENDFFQLKRYQESGKIQNRDYRDHYYHSIQCFLIGVSLYNFLLLKVGQNYNNPIEKIFCISFYHDLGYVYNLEKTRSNDYNKALKNLFSSINDRTIVEIRETFCIEKEITDDTLKMALRSNDAKEIWHGRISPLDKDKIKNLCGISDFKGRENHAIGSSVLLERLSVIKELCSSTYTTQDLKTKEMLIDNSFSVQSEQYEDFIEILKAITFHNFKMQKKLDLNNYFWPCFLMIIDELQTYGRPYRDEIFKTKLINPKYVGLEISNDKIKLDCSIGNENNSDISKKIYSEHSDKNVLKALSEKIEKESLELLFNAECVTEVCDD